MTTRSTTFGPRILCFGYTLLGFCAAVGLLTLLKGTPAQAQGPGVNLTALYNQVQTQQATINVLQTTVNAQTTKISTLQTQTQYISTGTDENGYPAMFITSCNVWVQDGSGSTYDGDGSLTGLGNLILGYNEPGNYIGGGDVRTGSHNLIVGDANNYSSYGGMVGGYSNEISNTYATVSGGQGNTARGESSSVSGGQFNTASGTFSSASGGTGNAPSGSYSSVSGGAGNAAIGQYSSVSGGAYKLAGTSGAWAGGSYHSP